MMGTLLRRDNFLSLPKTKSTGLAEYPSRSPKESPPTEKKKMKRVVVSNHIVRSNTFPGAESQPKSILKRDLSVRRFSESGDRRVQFNIDTFVQFIDDNGQQLTGTESLCLEPKDRKTFMARNLLRISNGYNCNGNEDSVTTQIFTYPNSNSDGTHEVHVSFVTDKEQGTKLKMLVKVGCQFSPEEICVKANMSGNKVRVIATKMMEYVSGNQKNEPFNERFLLPIEVDPYAVEARLDTKGNLTIEAPIMTHSKRSDIAKEKAESQNKSLL